MSEQRSVTRVKEVGHVITAHKQLEGGGFVVRRPLPRPGLDVIDPFLLIDEMGPVHYGPGEAVGAPDHPHRGFETVTYVLDGEMEHEDSAGHRGALGPGAVQWMTAGAGIVHSEEPSRRMREQGGRMHGFQIWVNLPAKLKMTRPRYQELGGGALPVAESADGRARVRIVAGEALGSRAAIDTLTPIAYHDWSLAGGADVTVPLELPTTLIYVFEGAALLGDGGREIKDGQLAVMGPGDGVRLRAAEGASARLLLLAATPLREPVARYGPFVMNSPEEIVQAMNDFRSGRMGEITRTAQVG